MAGSSLSRSGQVLETTVESVRGHLVQGAVRTEADVRQYVLSPLLRALGWNLDDPGAVRREYAVKGKKNYFFDYALFNRHQRVVFVIEAKAPGKMDADARDQLLLYAMKTETSLGVTTDGRSWSFYLPLAGGSSQARLVRTLNLETDGLDEAASGLERYLARSAVLAGEAHLAATSDRQRFALQGLVRSGWDDLVGGPSDKLVKALAAAARTTAQREGSTSPSGRVLNKVVRAFIKSGFSFPDDTGDVAPEPPEDDGDASGVQSPPRPPRLRAGRGPRAQGGAAWTYRGKRRVEKNPTEMYVAVIGRLYEDHGGADFYVRLRARIQGPKRAHLGSSPAATGVPSKYSRQLPGGWWLNTNLGTQDKIRKLRRACEAAGIDFGSDLEVEVPVAKAKSRQPRS